MKDLSKLLSLCFLIFSPSNCKIAANQHTLEDNTELDETPPSVSIVSPVDGSTLSDTILIEAAASDDIGVDHVNLYVDGTLIGSDTVAPYAQAFDTTTLSNGSYTVRGRAYDATNNFSDHSITITVANTDTDTKLMASDGADYDGFGESVAFSGGTAVFGSPRHSGIGGSNVGKAYVFHKNGSSWIEVQIITTANSKLAFLTPKIQP